MRRALFLLAALLTVPLAGCSDPRTVHHRGYAPDGYGIIDNSPHLPPPDHLMQPAPAPTPS